MHTIKLALLIGMFGSIALAPLASAQCEAEKWLAPSEHAALGTWLTLDLSGTTAVVGRPGHDAHGISDLGAVEVRRRDSLHVWRVELELVPTPDLAFVANLGRCVAIDGNHMVATFAVRGSADTVGFAAFERVGSAWVFVQVWLTPYAQLGHGRASMALDGEWLIVGAPGVALGAPGAGAVEVRRFVSGQWVAHQVLTAALPAANGEFGAALAIDGSRLAVGSPGADELHVFELAGNSTWIEVDAVNGSPAGSSRLGEHVDVRGLDVVASTRANGASSQVRCLHLVRAVSGVSVWSSLEWLEATGTIGSSSTTQIDDGVLLLGLPPTVAPAHGGLFVYRRAASGEPWVEQGGIAPTPPQAAGTYLGPIALSKDLAILAAVSAAGAEVRSFEFDELGDTLHACPPVISWTKKGNQYITIDVGPAGSFYPYWVIGSVSGTDVGFEFSGTYLPINFDWYTQIALSSPNVQLLYQNLGLLDTQGRATAIYQLPPQTGPWVIGAHADHVAVVINPLTLAVEFVTNTTALDITP